jgi:peptidoglycan endopeptidase LytF
VYYVVKSGDSPWKIAKQFNVKPEDILQLNHLDEEKARNLKIGDRIRIK